MIEAVCGPGNRICFFSDSHHILLRVKKINLDGPHYVFEACRYFRLLNRKKTYKTILLR